MLAMRLGDIATGFMGLWSALSAVLLMLVVVLLSLYLSLGIHKEALVATFRCVYFGAGDFAVPAHPCDQDACPKQQHIHTYFLLSLTGHRLPK